MDYKALVSKKVFGIPVLYLGAAAVTIFAIVAWKMKPTEEATGDENTTGDNVPDDPEDSPAADYAGLTGGGTVTVVQQGNTEKEEAADETNEDWERAAVTFLMENKGATPSDAQSAINKYLSGADLSYAEGALKDAAITKLGLPPEPLTTIGKVGTAPAQKQFSNFPGSHTVKGTNDNTPNKLAQLYYGYGDNTRAQLIVANNKALGPLGTTYNVGSVVKIPAWTAPRYFTVTSSTRYYGQVAAKNGITTDYLAALNPWAAAPFPVGTKLRVG